MDKIKVVFDKNKNETDLSSGMCNFASWNRLMPDLNKAFGISQNEKLIGIEVDSDGIVGRIERIASQ